MKLTKDQEQAFEIPVLGVQAECHSVEYKLELEKRPSITVTAVGGSVDDAYYNAAKELEKIFGWMAEFDSVEVSITVYPKDGKYERE